MRNTGRWSPHLPRKAENRSGIRQFNSGGFAQRPGRAPAWPFLSPIQVAERFNVSTILSMCLASKARHSSRSLGQSQELWIAESISGERDSAFGQITEQSPTRDIITFRHRIALSALDSWMIESLGALPQAEACAAALALDMELRRTCAAFVPCLHI